MKLNLDKPFYLIASYWLGNLQDFVKSYNVLPNKLIFEELNKEK